MITIFVAYNKSIIETYLMKRGDMSFFDGIRYVFSNIKSISYVYWRMLVRMIPAFFLTMLIAIILLIIGITLFKDNYILIGTLAILSYIPYIKRSIHLIFMSSYALWHEDYTLEGTKISEDSTRGIFWNIFWNYGFVFLAPMILSGII
jgi:hypothetical protein